jgi:hypothetical protein
MRPNRSKSPSGVTGNNNNPNKFNAKNRAHTKENLRARLNNKEEKMDIFYVQPNKPLVYSFFDVSTMEQFLEKEPTSGIRKKQEKKQNELTREGRSEREQSINFGTDEMKVNSISPEQVKKKKDNKEGNEIIEGSLRGEKIADSRGKKGLKKNSNNVEETKKESKHTVKFKTYTNSVIFANNELKSISNIHIVLNEIIPDLTFYSVKSKIELIQWIDISRNHLTEVHYDILQLPFLKILYMHGNFIQEIEKVEPLTKCQSLTSLTLYGNPIDHIKGYRQFIIEMVPLLEKFDYALVSEKELDIIHHKGSQYGEQRRKGKVVRYPKLPEEILKTIKIPEGNSKDRKEDS